MSDRLTGLLEGGDAEEISLAAPGRPRLTYAQLRADVDRLAGQLRAGGVGGGDRVAIVLPNGPEMAIAFLAVAACATAAPLNPAYREPEFRFFLRDLDARALITRPDAAAPARAAASEQTRQFTLEGEAGTLRLSRDGRLLGAAAWESAGSEEVALVLHTSGTTARPKQVPLLQRNLAASARNIARSLDLGPGDRSLNVMPLFHIHGLLGSLLASLASGASVACTPGFDAFRFFDWLGELRPTWYTAVPTMHQLVLGRGRRRPDAVAGAKLRFMRSSSAPLAPTLMAGMEELFGVPMIEAYGMTEASHQIAVNPLPPGLRKPGSVGLPVGVELAIAREAGEFLAQGERGEVVIKGEGVTPGYHNDADANATAFNDGWFRTGDQGFLDEDGYLFLTGRLKELINRGGEKIAPREVDEVLLAHPAVDQAVAFALSHDTLGEEVAAVVVLAEGCELTEREIRAYAAERLAAFKVPRRVVFLDEIPRGPTGKLQRIGLAERLGIGC